MPEKFSLENYINETKKSPEIINSPNCHFLTKMTVEELEDLAQRVADFEGTIRIFIHPEFGLLGRVEDSEVEGANDTPEEYERRSKDAMATIAKLLKMPNDKCPPMILFEEETFCEALSYIYRSMAKESGQDFYMLTTQDGESTPTINTSEIDPNQPNGGERVSTGKSWHIISTILRAAGVKKIIIGGGALKFSPTSQETEEQFASELETVYGEFRRQRQQKGANNVKYIPNHCLGTAVNFLSNNFDVELSGLSYPEGRKQQREIENNFYQ